MRMIGRVTYFDSNSGVHPSAIQQDNKLAHMFNILSVNTDRRGSPFVSSLEGISHYMCYCLL